MPHWNRVLVLRIMSVFPFELPLLNIVRPNLCWLVAIPFPLHKVHVVWEGHKNWQNLRCQFLWPSFKTWTSSSLLGQLSNSVPISWILHNWYSKNLLTMSSQHFFRWFLYLTIFIARTTLPEIIVKSSLKI